MTDKPASSALWQDLKRFTGARVALGRVGSGLPTGAHLRFQYDHARARDAVYSRLDIGRLMMELEAAGLEPVALHSAASDRHVYLQRPDLGRALDAPSHQTLAEMPQGYDVVFTLADGLSATAINRHALPTLHSLLPGLRQQGWHLGPTVVAEQARVAIGDEVGQALGAKMVVVFIGERPGLSAPDSLGIYLTWQPRPGVTDAERNCISNVRTEGLSYETASARLLYLMTESRRRALSGVALKDDTPRIAQAVETPVLEAGEV